VKGTLAQHGLQITELSTHLQGQLVAVHPAYDAGFGCRSRGARQPGGASSGRQQMMWPPRRRRTWD
jgi:hypothetical protein